MECKLWRPLYQLVLQVGKDFRRPRVRYSNAVILLVSLWACLHERPLSWACREQNWKSTRLKPSRLPSDSTLSHRLRSPEIQMLKEAIQSQLRKSEDPSLWRLWKIIDGKALTVGGCTKDPDAKAGRISSGFGRGYKLHAIWGIGSLPDAWDVRPLNVNEKRVAHELVPQLTGNGYLLADTQYDSNGLHDLCRVHQHQLVAPRMKTARGFAHGYRSRHRLHALEMLQRPFGRALMKQRKVIERHFGNATSFAGGLAPLPAWVRRLNRVRHWVWAKLVINAVRIEIRKQLTT